MIRTPARGAVAAALAVPVLARDPQLHEYIPTVMPFMPQRKDAYAGNDTMGKDDGEYNAAMQAGHFFPDDRWHTTLVVNLGHPGEHPGLDRLPPPGPHRHPLLGLSTTSLTDALDAHAAGRSNIGVDRDVNTSRARMFIIGSPRWELPPEDKDEAV